MKELTIYEASDGRRFDNSAECAAYENVIEFSRVVGITAGDIEMVLRGLDRELGDAIELLGKRIAIKRIELGGSKRASKPAAGA